MCRDLRAVRTRNGDHLRVGPPVGRRGGVEDRGIAAYPRVAGGRGGRPRPRLRLRRPVQGTRRLPVVLRGERLRRTGPPPHGRGPRPLRGAVHPPHRPRLPDRGGRRHPPERRQRSPAQGPGLRTGRHLPPHRLETRHLARRHLVPTPPVHPPNPTPHPHLTPRVPRSNTPSPAFRHT